MEKLILTVGIALFWEETRAPGTHTKKVRHLEVSIDTGKENQLATAELDIFED